MHFHMRHGTAEAEQRHSKEMTFIQRKSCNLRSFVI